MTIIQHADATRVSETTEEWTLPRTCPKWCDGDHARVLAEGASMEEARKHRYYLQDVSLDEIRNGAGQWIWREGSSGYDVCLEQDDGDALVELIVSESHDDGHDLKRAQIRLTTGEARVLAAKLVWAADRADLDS